MLKIRIITALVMLPIVLVALFMFSDWAWDIFTLVITLVACWEWSRFCPFKAANAARPAKADSKMGKLIYFVISALISALIFFAYLQTHAADFPAFRQLALWGCAISAVFWFFIAPLWLSRSWRAPSVAIAAITGWVVIFPTWLALLVLHDRSPWLLLTFALIVWVADVAAYFSGKAFGKHKLAPTISPSKTIEGVIGGLAGVTLYFFLWQIWAHQTWARGETWVLELTGQGGWLWGFFMLLAVASVLGDLFESWMKRGVGMKDSSHLLPGHGGILDRIDALTSTLPIAGLYLMLVF